VKYLLIVFYMTGQWPFTPRMEFAQLGPYDNVLSCEAAARQAEHVVMSIGADRVGSFCSPTLAR
jgi:hypothetical protein